VSNIWEELSDRIKGEVEELDRVVHRTQDVWKKAHLHNEQQDVFLDSVVLNLHGFYSGIEKLFELIAGKIDKNIPSSKTWHRDLLQKMAKEVPNVRPAVINSCWLPKLDELRRFRHLVRNVYTFNIVPTKVEPIVCALPDLWPHIKDELLAFADFLSAKKIHDFS
jgi:hypothetical protein